MSNQSTRNSPEAPNEKGDGKKAKGKDESHGELFERTEAGNLFLYEDLFPDAHEAFTPNTGPDAKADCLIVLDTNVLLLPYSFVQDDLSPLESAYQNVARENRLYLPEHVAREFIRNRDSTLANLVNAIGVMQSSINIGKPKLSPLLQDLTESADLAKANSELVAAKKAYLATLDKLISQMRSWRGNDPMTKLYATLFPKERLSKPSASREKLINEWKARVASKTPPGYKDAQKSENAMGDFIIWKTLLELGATHRKDLIFVTGDSKSDWFVADRLYPRPELVHEYRLVSGGRTLRLSSLHEFLKDMAAPAAFISRVEAAEANSASYSAAAALVGIATLGVSFTIEGTRTFDYSTHNGRLGIQERGMSFDLRFSKASNVRIDLHRDGTTRRIARVKPTALNIPITMDAQETTSSFYRIQVGDGFLVENSNGDVLACRLLHVKDDTREDDRDEVTFKYAAYESGSVITLP